jgi:L-rhamnose-H+ transport protein
MLDGPESSPDPVSTNPTILEQPEDAMDLVTGAVLSILAGALEGLFSLPLAWTPKWKWENIWGMGSLAALILVPWPVALLTVPSLGQVYQDAGAKFALIAVVGGLSWGIGGIFWGRAIGAVGLALGVSLMMGLVTVFGSPVPLALKEPGKLIELGGLILLGALAVMVLGVVVCAWAGKLKNREMASTSAASQTAGSGVPFTLGLLFCFVSAVASAMVNVGYVFAEPIAAAAENLRASKISAPNAVWALIFTANFGLNVAYTFYLMFRNRTFRLLRAPGTAHYWLWVLFMGIAWPSGLVLYGIGAGKMGTYGPFVAWPMMLLSSILFGNLAGALGGEWKNTSSKPRGAMVAGVAILVVAFLIFGVAQKFLAATA